MKKMPAEEGKMMMKGDMMTKRGARRRFLKIGRSTAAHKRKGP